MSDCLALGDSYTIGEGVTRDESWPLVLSSLLATRTSRLGTTEIIATTGWTTDELMAAIEAEQPSGPFELVTLLIGVNDQYRGRTPSEYRTGLVPLLERAVVLAGDDAGHVLAISIPDWGLTPFAEGRDRAAIAREIQEFNAVAAEAAARAGCRWADIRAAQDADRGTLLVADALHPSARAYEAWASALLPFARAALGRA